MHQGSQAFVLIGGIGAGKSYVAAILRAKGVTMIEADRIGHQVLSAGGAAFELVARQWPMVLVDGEIHRSALGKIVFSDPDQLALLESFTHPAIASEIADQVRSASTDLVGIERPFLDGAIGEGLPVIVVDAADEVRKQRLIGRGMDADDIDRRMAVQPARQQWLETADFVIDNAPGTDIDRAVDEAVAWLREFVPDNR